MSFDYSSPILAVLQFHPETGPSVVSIAPTSCPLTSIEQRSLAFLAFPNFALSTKHKISHFFRLRLTSAILGSSPNDQNYMTAIAAFRQDIVEEGRGARQQSLVLLLSGKVYPSKYTMLIAFILELVSENVEQRLDEAYIDVSNFLSLLKMDSRDALHEETRQIAKCSFRNVNFRVSDFTLPFPSFLKEALFFLWEALLSDWSIAVFAETNVSISAMQLIELITPAEYRGDFRPYISFYDHDVEMFMRARSTRVLGVADAALLEQLSSCTDAVLYLHNQQSQSPRRIAFNSWSSQYRTVTEGEDFTLYASENLCSSSSSRLFRRKSRRRLRLGPDAAVLQVEDPEVLRTHFRKLTQWALDGGKSRYPGSVQPDEKRKAKFFAKIHKYVSSVL
jgi:hypothetical protein